MVRRIQSHSNEFMFSSKVGTNYKTKEHMTTVTTISIALIRMMMTSLNSSKSQGNLTSAREEFHVEEHSIKTQSNKHRLACGIAPFLSCLQNSELASNCDDYTDY